MLWFEKKKEGLVTAAKKGADRGINPFGRVEKKGWFEGVWIFSFLCYRLIPMEEFFCMKFSLALFG